MQTSRLGSQGLSFGRDHSRGFSSKCVDTAVYFEEAPDEKSRCLPPPRGSDSNLK